MSYHFFQHIITNLCQTLNIQAEHGKCQLFFLKPHSTNRDPIRYNTQTNELLLDY